MNSLNTLTQRLDILNRYCGVCPVTLCADFKILSGLLLIVYYVCVDVCVRAAHLRLHHM